MMKFQKNYVLRSAILALPLLGLTAPTAFADQAPELIIQDFIGTINWSNGGGTLEITDRKKARNVEITTENNVMSFDGAFVDLDGDKCQGFNGSYDLNFFGKKSHKGVLGGYEDLEDYPTLTLSLPTDTKLTLINSIIFTQGQPDLAAADLSLTHCGKVNLGNVAGEVSVNGHGASDLTFKNARALSSHMKGSGDIKAYDVDFISAKNNGSGDLEVRQAGNIDIDTSGSGDVEIKTVTGSAIIETSGSGDFEIGSIAGSLDYRSSGSGDLELQRIGGSSENRVGLQSDGSGDIDINGGTISELFVKLSGSANADLDVTARDAVLKTSGSSEIYVDTVTGSLKKTSSGSSDIDVDNRD